MKNSFVGIHLDFIGFSASVACAIHCVALPFLISVLPFIGLGFLMNHWIEYSVILLSFFLAVFALSHGFWNHHRNSLAIGHCGIRNHLGWTNLWPWCRRASHFSYWSASFDRQKQTCTIHRTFHYSIWSFGSEPRPLY
ncbi:MerC domain-containing protein [Echinicola sp. CAU 1574]|uniref:MerC domain-containing protein n=1 Tax=Echinicola arenosa TaxID=2774144 RepID=A0ABR9AHK5_9BACT|nr:MerC domain-containing protein [Echinicola arenosa]